MLNEIRFFNSGQCPARDTLMAIHFMRRFFIAALMAASLSASAPAQSRYTWQNVKVVAGGYVPGIVFSDAQRGLAYCRTDIGSFYKWDDAAKQWVPLCDWCGVSNLMGGESIAADPHDANVVYLAAGMGTNQRAAIMRSRDQGKTFDVIDVPFVMGGNSDGRSVGERLAIDPNSTNVLYFASRQQGLWRSDDSASTWKHADSFPTTAAAPGARAGAGLSFVIIAPNSSSAGAPGMTIFVGSANPGPGPHLFCSRDAGATWQPIAGQPEGLLALKGALDARDVLYVTYANAAGPNGISAGAVWKYDFKGVVWTEITPVPQAGFCGLALDRQHPGTLAVTTLDRWNPGDDVLRTTDDGKTWKSLRQSAAMDISLSPYLTFGGRAPKFGWWMSALAIDPFDSNHAMYGTGATIYGTHDLTDVEAGKPTKWSVAADGMEETAIICLTSPTDGAHLISGFGDIGGFVHDDLSVSPPRGMFTNPVFTNCDALYCADMNPKIVVRQGRTNSGTQIALSEDGGHTWRPIRAPQAAPGARAGRAGRGGGFQGGGTLLLSADGSTIVFGAGALQYTNDQGVTWTPIKGLPPTAHLVADRVNPKKFYAIDAGSAQAYASTDGAATFTAFPSQGLSAAAPSGRGGGARLWATLGVEGDLFLAGGRSLLHSRDGGKSFAALTNAPSVMAGGLCFGFGKAPPGKTYPALFAAGTLNNITGIFRSDDAGRTWVRINDDQHQYGTRFRCLCGDPRVFGRVYVGTDGRGIVYGDISD